MGRNTVCSSTITQLFGKIGHNTEEGRGKAFKNLWGPCQSKVRSPAVEAVDLGAVLIQHCVTQRYLLTFLHFQMLQLVKQYLKCQGRWLSG